MEILSPHITNMPAEKFTYAPCFWKKSLFFKGPKEDCMLKAELAFAKSGVLSTRDWDTYQAILRKCLSFKKPLKKSTQKKKEQ